MTDAWFYANDAEKPVGPIAFDELKRLLWKMKGWRQRLVWNASFGEWVEAGSIPELNVQPPPVPKAKTKWWVRGVSVVVAVIVGSIVKTVVHEWIHTPSSATVEEVLDETEKQAKVPQKLNEVMTAVAVKHTGIKELTYVYRVNTNEYTPEPGFIVVLRKSVAPEVCKQMGEELNLGVTLWYKYLDAQGNELGRFGLNKNDCKQLSATR